MKIFSVVQELLLVVCSDRIGQCLKNRQFVRLAALITLLNARPRSFSQSYPQKVGRTILSISIVCSDLSRWAGEDRWSGLSGLFGWFGLSGWVSGAPTK